MTKEINEESEMLFTTNQMAKLLNLSARRIQQLAEEGILVKLNRGKYKLVVSVQQYIQSLQARDGGSDTEVDYFGERALHERAKRQMAEMNLSVMKGELHRSEDVAHVMNDMIAAFRSRTLAIPTKLAAQLVGKKMPVILQMLGDAVYEALNELSLYDPQKFHELNESFIEEHADGESG